MLIKSLFLLSSIVLTVFCLCCKEEDVELAINSCNGEVRFLSEPPPTGRNFEHTSLRIIGDCLVIFGLTTSCEEVILDMSLLVVAQPDSLPQLYLRLSPDSICANTASLNAAFDLVPVRSDEDSILLVFPEVDTSILYRY